MAKHRASDRPGDQPPFWMRQPPPDPVASTPPEQPRTPVEQPRTTVTAMTVEPSVAPNSRDGARDDARSKDRDHPPTPAPRPAPAARPRRSRLPWARAALGIAGIAIIATASVFLVHHEPPRQKPRVAAPAPSLPDAEARRQLQAGFAALDLKVPVGVAIVPVGGGGVPILLGDQEPQDAWSTIKVPLALAAERRNGENRTETKAVIDSDNRSARLLTRSLGTPAEATAAVTDVLREGGDRGTVVQPAADDGEWPHLGETTWTLTDSAVWTAHLPCMPGSEHVLDLMAHVAPTQDWGLNKIPGDRTAVKGGWGVDEGDEGYLVRQIGLITLNDGKRVAVSMSAHEPKMTFDAGAIALNTVGHWLGDNLNLLPGGSCPGAGG